MQTAMQDSLGAFRPEVTEKEEGLHQAGLPGPRPRPHLFLSSIKEQGSGADRGSTGAVPPSVLEGASPKDWACQRETGAAAGALASPGSEGVQELDDPNSPVSVRECKRRRLAEQHNQSEQRRRRKINSKLDELQAMVPFSRSREKAAILLDVIEYIKSVQAQLHIMSAITACDYATYGACPPSMDSFLPQPMGLGDSPAVLPTFIIPPASPLSPGVMPPGVLSPGFSPVGVGLEQYGMSLGGVKRPKTGRSKRKVCDTGGGGWSYSSGESSAPLGDVIDTTSSYEPLF